MISLRNRLYYKLLPIFIRIAEHFEFREYTRQKASIEKKLLLLPPGEGFRGILFLTHGRGGGVEQYVEDAADTLEASGKQAWILYFHPLQRQFILSCRKAHSEKKLSFQFPAQYADMVAYLRTLGIEKLSIQHTRYLPLYLLKDLAEFAEYLEVPYSYTMHDFIALCPRIHLIDGNFSYCGMPQDTNICNACVKKNGMLTIAPKDVLEWRRIHHALLAKASALVAPSHDTADRHTHILGDLKIEVTPHDFPPLTPRKLSAKTANEPYIIAVIGRLHRHKGADILLACARNARQRNLPLVFLVIGNSIHASQLDTAGVRLTGIYEETELPELLQKSKASLVFLPSVWPETYSYVLSRIWQNGYFPVAFDLGAPAERIKAANNGLVLPISMINSPMLINDFLLKAAREQHES